jgi:hypothetical protein
MNVEQMKNQKTGNKICHHCGMPRTEEEKSDEHIPPRRFFPKELRKKLSGKVNFIPKQPAHRVCNESYREDEAYFYWHLGLCTVDGVDPATRKIGDIICDELFERVKNKKEDWRNIEIVINSFSHLYYAKTMLSKDIQSVTNPKWGITDSGLYVPESIDSAMMLSRINVSRIERVIWKIIKGLFFYENNRYLPDTCKPNSFIIHNDRMEMTDELDLLLSLGVPQGNNQEFFSYKLQSKSNEKITKWLCIIALWKYWYLGAWFLDPECA